MITMLFVGDWYVYNCFFNARSVNYCWCTVSSVNEIVLSIFFGNNGFNALCLIKNFAFQFYWFFVSVHSCLFLLLPNRCIFSSLEKGLQHEEYDEFCHCFCHSFLVGDWNNERCKHVRWTWLKFSQCSSNKLKVFHCLCPSRRIEATFDFHSTGYLDRHLHHLVHLSPPHFLCLCQLSQATAHRQLLLPSRHQLLASSNFHRNNQHNLVSSSWQSYRCF